MISGNGFLYNMVRIIAGVLIKVGLEQKEPEEVREAGGASDGKGCGTNGACTRIDTGGD